MHVPGRVNPAAGLPSSVHLPGLSGRDDIMGENLMRENLERIRIWLERETPHLAASLQPGLSLAEMRNIMGAKSADYRMPEEVVELYEWRNGQAGNVPFFDVVRFQPFEDAVAYANLAEAYFDGGFPLMVFQELNYDAGYQFRCGPVEQKSAPAYRWMHGDERIETPSLEDLLSAVAEAFEGGAFRPNDLGELDTDEGVWNSILVRHHPDRVRGVNALLHRQWTELSGEQLRDAFYDLVLTNRTETAALVREYLCDSQDRPVWDFEAFHAALSVGIEIQDEWTRDRTVSLAFGQDPRVRRAALTSLAWSWRGELPLTAQHVDGLIDQIMTSPASDQDNRERAMLLGISGDRRAVPVLLRLINDPPADCGARDTRIAALRALGSLRAVGARQVCLTIAETDSDPGTRIAAVRSLLDLGFEDAPVEAAAKAYVREMLRRFGNLPEHDETPTLKRWIEETRQSASG